MILIVGVFFNIYLFTFYKYFNEMGLSSSLLIIFLILFILSLIIIPIHRYFIGYFLEFEIYDFITKIF